MLEHFQLGQQGQGKEKYFFPQFELGPFSYRLHSGKVNKTLFDLMSNYFLFEILFLKYPVRTAQFVAR